MAKLRILFRLEPSAAVRLEMRPLRAASRFGPIRTRVNGVSEDKKAKWDSIESTF